MLSSRVWLLWQKPILKTQNKCVRAYNQGGPAASPTALESPHTWHVKHALPSKHVDTCIHSRHIIGTWWKLDLHRNLSLHHTAGILSSNYKAGLQAIKAAIQHLVKRSGEANILLFTLTPCLQSNLLNLAIQILPPDGCMAVSKPCHTQQHGAGVDTGACGGKGKWHSRRPCENRKQSPTAPDLHRHI